MAITDPMNPARPVRAVVTGAGIAAPGVPSPAALLGAGPGHAAEPVDPEARMGTRGLRYKDRATRLALCAARDALRAAGLADGGGQAGAPGETTGVVVSSKLSNLDTVCAVAGTIAAGTVAETSPMDLPNASSNEVASSVAIWFGLRGANLTLCNGATSGLDAVWWAAVLISAGRVDRVLVIGVETQNEVVRTLFGPGGPALFDGAVAVVVESAGAALNRGARPLAEIGEYARSATTAELLTRLPLPAAIGLWLVPGASGGPSPQAGAVPGGAAPAPLDRLPVPVAATHDLTVRHGLACGAFGVLQCAAAAAWLERGGWSAGAPVLATAESADAAAALMLRPVAGTR